MTDLSPERLFLEPNCCVDPRQGRMWCEDDVWPDCGSHEEGGVEYVRADLARQRIADVKRIAELEEALVDHNDQLRSAVQVAHREGRDTNWLTLCGAFHYTLAEHQEVTNTARAALKDSQ